MADRVLPSREADLLMMCPCGCRSIVTMREWLMKDIVAEALEYANGGEDDDDGEV